MLFQILLGSWPLDLQADDRPAMEQYSARILQWQEKALREAKLRTTGAIPTATTKAPAGTWSTCWPPKAHHYGRNRRRSRELAPAGALNSLVQTLLRMTTPVCRISTRAPSSGT